MILFRKGAVLNVIRGVHTRTETAVHSSVFCPTLVMLGMTWVEWMDQSTATRLGPLLPLLLRGWHDAEHTGSTKRAIARTLLLLIA